MKTRRSIAGFAVGLLLVASAGAWVAWRHDMPTATAATASTAAQATPPSAPPDVALATRIAPAGNTITVPEGMTPAQWQSLNEQLKNHPQREAEIARVSAAVTYLSRLDRYRALATPATATPSPDSRELAAWLLDQLPARIANKEVSGQEGQRLQAALLDTLGATAAQRDAAQQRLTDAVPIDASLQAKAELDARYQREAAALLATWRAQPAAQRDAQQLEASLGALRRSVFSNPASADASAGALR